MANFFEKLILVHLYKRFGMNLPLLPQFVYASSKLSGETAHAQLGIGSSASQYHVYNMIIADAISVLKIALKIGYDRQFVSKR